MPGTIVAELLARHRPDLEPALALQQRLLTLVLDLAAIQALADRAEHSDTVDELSSVGPLDPPLQASF